MFPIFNVFSQSYASLPFTTDFSETGNDLSGNWAEVAGANYFAKRQTWANEIPTGRTSSGKALTFYTSDTIGYDVHPEAWLYVDLSNANVLDINFMVVDNSSYLINDTIFVDVSVDGGATFTNNVAHRSMWESPHFDWNWNEVTELIDLTSNGLVGTSTSVIRLRASTNFEFIPSPFFWNYTGHMIAIDDLSLSKTTTLPVEIYDFSCGKNTLNWTTLSEVQNDYFTVEYSKNGFNWETTLIEEGKGDSFLESYYSNGITSNGYYKLSQTDFNGKTTILNTVYCKTEIPLEIEGYYNLNGQEITKPLKPGIILIHYSDGTVEKRIITPGSGLTF